MKAYYYRMVQGVQVKVWLALIVLWTAAVPALAQTDSDTGGTGTSHGFAVADGDTVKFGRQRVRLFGIDAPEKGQPRDDGHWYPGPLATKALIAFIAGRPVSCHQVDYDQKNNRPVAVCFAGKDDLQALMVSAGWAWAYTAFSDQYADAERRATARGVGVHAHRCQPPWEWRALKRAER
jgi:endonuclease YncB( thermonuclease family)